MAFEPIVMSRYKVHGIRIGCSVSSKSNMRTLRMSIGSNVIEEFGLTDDSRIEPLMGTLTDLGLLKLIKCTEIGCGRRVFIKNDRAEITFSARPWRVTESHNTEQCSKWHITDDGNAIIVTLPGWVWSHLDKAKRGV